MCQRFVDFCNDATKPLLSVGALATFSLAAALSYIIWTQDFADYSILGNVPIFGYHLYLIMTVGLVYVTVLGCVAAYYDHKLAVTALVSLGSMNCIIVIAAVVMLPALKDVQESYAKQIGNMTHSYFVQGADPVSAPYENATLLWDSINNHGCCGPILNATVWGPSGKYPKSCCNKPETDKGQIYCQNFDDDHKHVCADIISNSIESKDLFLHVLLYAMMAAYLYVATVSGISTHRKVHYEEANQGACS